LKRGKNTPLHYIGLLVKFESPMAQYSVGFRNLEIMAPVGVHAEERALKVRLLVSASLSFPETEHLPVSLQTSFDYARLIDLIEDVCKHPHNLLEQVAHAVITKLQPIVDKPCELHIRIEKLNPVPRPVTGAAYVDVIEQLSPGKTRR
jgi:dihydroneopterin aldolase